MNWKIQAGELRIDGINPGDGTLIVIIILTSLIYLELHCQHLGIIAARTGIDEPITWKKIRDPGQPLSKHILVLY